MKMISLKELTQVVNGKLYGNNIYLNYISTDTRNMNSGGLFIALIGKNFDGHDYINNAIEKGAKALLINKKITFKISHIVVKDTKLALGDISSWIRQQFKVNLIAITGSSGKTSVKEMTATILQECDETLYSEGNFNNDIGLSITLLRLHVKHKYAVIELGANHVGEIQYMSKILNPDSVLINNIAASHLEGFGSLDKVYLAKGEILSGLKKKVLLLLIAIVMIGLIGKNIFMEKRCGIFLYILNTVVIFGLVK